MKTPSHRDRLLVGIILLVGLTLRLFRLGAESLWYDETVSAYLAGSPVTELIRHTAGDIHPPGYYLLLRGWLLLTGFGDGRADPLTFGLEFFSAFLSLIFGVLLIALVYALARRLAGQRVALLAAAFVALSPFNVWYSQEVRMYTVGAVLGLAALRALLALALSERPLRHGAAYAVAAALGMYVLYYFAFLLVALNAWAAIACWRRRRSIRGLLLANLAAAILYAPWIPVAFRQAIQPPVPPWRTPPDLVHALVESWTALSFGQSAPHIVWPALLLTLTLYALGLGWFAAKGRSAVDGRLYAGALAAATLGPLLLILAVSLATPLYHVRYLFTYSPAFYILLAAGTVALAEGVRRGHGFRAGGWRAAATVGVSVWVAGAALTLAAYWNDPAYRADDHRSAVRELEARWQPGDAVVVNAGWAYTAFATYWTGETSSRTRITQPLPQPRSDTDLVMVTTGHTDGDPELGWADERSDFFAMPADVAMQRVPSLFERFRRVWHYRIYDTVNDPDGLIRAVLPRYGQQTDDRRYPGEAFMRVENYVPRDGVEWEPALPGASYSGGLALRFRPVEVTVEAGEPAYVDSTWRAASPLYTRLATSLRLLGPDGELVHQPPDEQPLGPLFPSIQWPVGVAQPQSFRIAAPEGTLPGDYQVILVTYNAETGEPLLPAPVNGAQASEPGLKLGTLNVLHPGATVAPRPEVADFGPVALLEARTPVTAIAPGGEIPVELLWQSRHSTGDLVVVLQLLREDGSLAANLEEQPAQGRRPTSQWTGGELVRDRHGLNLPPAIEPGRHRLIVGLYEADDGTRLKPRAGLLGNRDYYEIGVVDVR